MKRCLTLDPDIFPNLCVSIITELDEWNTTCMGLNERPTINDIAVREDEKEGSIYIEDGALWVEYPWPGILETVNSRKLENYMSWRKKRVSSLIHMKNVLQCFAN